jgi:hypothetical protein
MRKIAAGTHAIPAAGAVGGGQVSIVSVNSGRSAGQVGGPNARHIIRNR